MSPWDPTAEENRITAVSLSGTCAFSSAHYLSFSFLPLLAGKYENADGLRINMITKGRYI